MNDQPIAGTSDGEKSLDTTEHTEDANNSGASATTGVAEGESSGSDGQTGLITVERPEEANHNGDGSSSGAAGGKSGSDAEARRLTILEHLDELRKRIIVCSIAIAVTTVLSFLFAGQMFDILKAPAGETQFQAIEMMELFSTYLKVSLFAGLVLAMPVLLYQIVMFIAPALTRKEKKYFFFLLPGGLLSFVLGVVFGYYVLLPPAINFLLTFGAEIATPVPRIGNYISTVTRLLFYIGVAFETPLVIYFLCKMRILTPNKLATFRKYAVVGAWVLAAMITPTFDPVNQTMVAIPLILLYEVGILLARFL